MAAFRRSAEGGTMFRSQANLPIITISGVLVLTLVFGFPVLAAGQSPAFSDIPQTSEFTFVNGNARHLLGGIRALTTGDYDHDGDEDVFVGRFADEGLGVPQFVLYKNVSTPGNIHFVVAGHGDNGFPNFTEIHSDKNQEFWGEKTGVCNVSGTVTADFNNDGWPDIFVGGTAIDTLNAPGSPGATRIIDRSLLFINLRDPAGAFVEVGDRAGLIDTTTFCQGAAIADYNRDGLLDIFMANTADYQATKGPGAPNSLYICAGIDSFLYAAQMVRYPVFQDQTAAWQIAPDDTEHFAPSAADFDNDGDMDIYVCYRQRADEVFQFDPQTPNVLLVNEGDHFVDEAVSLGVADNGNGYGSCWGDFNNDGKLDLLMANNQHPGEIYPGEDKSTMNQLFVNNYPGAFTTLTVPAFADSFCLDENNGAFFFDYDLDGLQDFGIAVETDHPGWGTMIFHQAEPDSFVEVTEEEGAGPCTPTVRVNLGANSTYADFDGDGDLDMFLTQALRAGVSCDTTGATYVEENRTRTGQPSDPHYIAVRLQGGERPDGVKALADGIGSQVFVYAGGNHYMQQVNAGAQDGSTFPMDLTFGLGSATTVDSIVVEWRTYAGPSPFRQKKGGPINADRPLLFKINPDTTFVPNDVQHIQEAVNGALTGHVVAVNGKNLDGSPRTYLEWVMMKDGVKVIPIPGTGTPTIDGGTIAGQAVGFPDGVGPNTILEGFKITGGTTQIVHLGQGNGIIRNCTIYSSGTGATMGVNFTAGTGTVENCSVAMTNAGGSDVGIRVSSASPTIDSDDVTVTEGKGIYVASGEPIISGCSIRVSNGASGNRGILTGGPWTTPGAHITHNLIHVPGGYGIECGMSLDTTRYCTVDSAAIGLKDVAGGWIDHCIATHCSTTGIVTGLLNEATDCITPDGFSPAPGAGSVEEDPLYCPGSYTLRADSYGNPSVNGTGVAIGAYPVECLSGELVRSVSWSGADPPLLVPQDATVPDGLSLTLLPGATLTFDKLDESGGGTFPNGTELTVNGRMTAGDVNGATVLFTTTDTTLSGGKWGCITLAGNDSTTIQNAVIQGASIGVQVKGSHVATITQLQISSTSNGITAYDSCEVNLVGSTISGVADGLSLYGTAHSTVSYTAITASNIGIYMGGSGELENLVGSSVTSSGSGIKMVGGTASVSASATITGSSLVGVWVESDGSATINGATIQDSDTGIYANGGTIAMPTGTITGGRWGAYVDQGGNLSLGSVVSGSTPAVTISGASEEGVGVDTDQPCTLTVVKVEGTTDPGWVGIHLLPGSDTEVERCEVTGASGYGAVGIMVEGSSLLTGPKVSSISWGGAGTGIQFNADSTEAIQLDESTYQYATWHHPDIEGCYFGIDVLWYSRPVIRNSIITADSAYCVRIGPVAKPDLGQDNGGGVQDPGNNNISGNPANKLAGGKIRDGSAGNVTAEGNYWGSSHPDATKISTWVDYTPYLHNNPINQAGSGVPIGAVSEEKAVRKLPYPMPFSDRVNLPVQVAGETGRVEIRIFDVAGRLVRAFRLEGLAPGYHDVSWDGREGNGHLAPSGIYFAKIVAGEEVQSRKLVLSR